MSKLGCVVKDNCNSIGMVFSTTKEERIISAIPISCCHPGTICNNQTIARPIVDMATLNADGCLNVFQLKMWTFEMCLVALVGTIFVLQVGV